MKRSDKFATPTKNQRTKKNNTSEYTMLLDVLKTKIRFKKIIAWLSPGFTIAFQHVLPVGHFQHLYCICRPEGSTLSGVDLFFLSCHGIVFHVNHVMEIGWLFKSQLDCLLVPREHSSTFFQRHTLCNDISQEPFRHEVHFKRMTSQMFSHCLGGN